MAIDDTGSRSEQTAHEYNEFIGPFWYEAGVHCGLDGLVLGQHSPDRRS